MNLTDAHVTDEAISAAKSQYRGHMKAPQPAAIESQQLFAAIEAGWFELPRGRNHAYTQKQFSRFTDLIKALPAVIDVQARSVVWTGKKMEELKERFSFVFGLPNTFPDIRQWAQSLPYGGPRRPIEFKAGILKAQDLLHCLEDAVNTASSLNRLMTALEPKFMMDRTSSIESQVARLWEYDQIQYLEKFLYALRGKYLSKEDRRWLWEVKNDRITITEFDRRISKREAEATKASMQHWKGVYESLSRLAVFLMQSGINHHGRLTRALRERFGSSFRLRRDGSNCGGLVIDLEDGLCVGAGQRLIDCQTLTRFIWALNAELAQASPDIHSYYSAVEKALIKFEQITSSAEKAERRIDTLELQEQGHTFVH